MNTSYCGKDCEKCRAENDHGCEGCKSGKVFRPGDCKIVDCLATRGLDDCQLCGNKLSCSMIYNNDKFQRLEKNRYEAMPPYVARGLGKWFKVLFLISLGQAVCSVFKAVAILIAPIYTIAYFVACFVLYDYSVNFKKSAFTLIVKMLFGISAIIVALLIRTDDLKFLAYILFGCTFIIGVVSECYKFKGCIDVTQSNAELSDDWKKLIKWNIYVSAGLIISFILANVPIVDTVATGAVFIALICMVILSITEIVLFSMTKDYFVSIDNQ